MVFLAENFNFVIASCCSLLVIKGGRGFLTVDFFRTFSTIKVKPDNSPVMPEEVSSFEISIFFPFFFTSFAVNADLSPVSRYAVIDQYSSDIKDWIERSLSHMMRRATD